MSRLAAATGVASSTQTTVGVIAAIVVCGGIVAAVVVVGVRASRRPSKEVMELARRGFVRVDPVPSTNGSRGDWLVTPLRRADATTTERERVWLDTLGGPHRAPVLWSAVTIPYLALGDTGVDGIVSDGGGVADGGGGDGGGDC